MKVFLHYEDNDNSDLHKSLKITLPKSWKSGPVSNLLQQFVESYNAKHAELNPLAEADLHLAQRCQVVPTSEKTEMVAICSDAIVLDEIADRADVYICHGPSQTIEERSIQKQKADDERQAKLQSTVSCTHFGCQNRFPRGGPYPECRYHRLPPVFHETAKYWACCPTKKAYDWDDFQSIPGCEIGRCTEVKDQGQKLFLGGTDLREQAAEASKLKSIDDFNKAQSAGGAEAAPVLERLQSVFQEMGIERELFDQVVNGLKEEHSKTCASDAELLQSVLTDLSSKLKVSMKSIAAEQLRIK